MPLALLVNPSSGRRPDAEAAAAGRAGARRSAASSSGSSAPGASSTASSRRCGAVEAGEVPVVVSGDGLIGAIGGAMAGAETPLGIIPGGRGNDLARVLGIPDDPEAAVAVARSPARRRRIDVGEANGKRFLGIVSVGFDSEANRLANETQLPARQPRLRLRRAAHPGRLEAGPLHGPRRRRARPLHRLLGLGRQQQGLRRRHVHRPRRRARRRRVRHRRGRRGRQAPLPG